MYLSEAGSISRRAGEPSSDSPLSTMKAVGVSAGALNGITISTRPLVPWIPTDCYGESWVEIVKASCRPPPKSAITLARRSVLKAGSRSTSETTRCSSAPKS